MLTGKGEIQNPKMDPTMINLRVTWQDYRTTSLIQCTISHDHDI